MVSQRREQFVKNKRFKLLSPFCANKSQTCPNDKMKQSTTFSVSRVMFRSASLLKKIRCDLRVKQGRIELRRGLLRSGFYDCGCVSQGADFKSPEVFQ